MASFVPHKPITVFRISCQKVKDSLRKLVNKICECLEYPVHRAVRNGDVKFVDLILNISYDLNATDDALGLQIWQNKNRSIMYHIIK